MKSGMIVMSAAIGMLLGLGNHHAMGVDPEHGLVGIRPWPVNPSHQATPISPPSGPTNGCFRDLPPKANS